MGRERYKNRRPNPFLCLTLPGKSPPCPRPRPRTLRPQTPSPDWYQAVCIMDHVDVDLDLEGGVELDGHGTREVRNINSIADTHPPLTTGPGCDGAAGNGTEGEPYVGQEFDSEAEALEFYCSYAMRVGFLTRIRDQQCSQRDGSCISRTLVCNKEGHPRPKDRLQVSRRKALSQLKQAPTRLGCQARVSFKKHRKTGKWFIRSLVKDHTHPFATGTALRARVYQIPTDDNRVNELTQELVEERRRNAALKEFIGVLLNHIEEHTQGLSKKIQNVLDKVNKIESEDKNHKSSR